MVKMCGRGNDDGKCCVIQIIKKMKQNHIDKT